MNYTRPVSVERVKLSRCYVEIIQKGRRIFEWGHNFGACRRHSLDTPLVSGQEPPSIFYAPCRGDPFEFRR